MEYTFTYDSFDRVTKISVAGATLAQYSYDEKTGLLLEMTYGDNLHVISYTYDIFGRVTEIYHGANLAYSYEYHTNGGVYLDMKIKNLKLEAMVVLLLQFLMVWAQLDHKVKLMKIFIIQ